MSKHQWILDGLARPGKNRIGLARALGRQPSMVTDLLSGRRALRADEIPKIAQYLDVVAPSPMGLARIVGSAGQDADGAIRFENNNEGEAPMPPGGSKDTVAVKVVGSSMRGIAQEGWLLYFDNLREPPSDEMLGELCVVGLKDGRTLVKYMHRGRGTGLYDLESATAPTLRDVAVDWAALVTAIIPRPQARKIVRGETPERKRPRPKRRR
jgi:hypothetical protein